jgi:hypothetical protein
MLEQAKLIKKFIIKNSLQFFFKGLKGFISHKDILKNKKHSLLMKLNSLNKYNIIRYLSILKVKKKGIIETITKIKNNYVINVLKSRFKYYKLWK